MCRAPMQRKWPDQGQPPWIAYSLRDVRTARAGQIPSPRNLGVTGGALKTQGDIFYLAGNCVQPVRHAGR